MDLFGDLKNTRTPLAERLRPRSLREFIGQAHLLGDGKILRKTIASDQLSSMIFWGPPGVGKTTLACIIAAETTSDFFSISAVTTGVAEVRKIIKSASDGRKLGMRTILFIDEIHRFNKAQQDALLHAVEDGTLLLIGATTENPGFEVISALLSRCRVYKLEALTHDDLQQVLERALEQDAEIKNLRVKLSDDARSALITLAGGDARNLLTALDLAAQSAPVDEHGERSIDRPLVEEAMQRRALLYDKKGEYHYDVISAFIKSVRGSDPDAAIYWLARMVDAGEDPKFIARRLIVLAAEDIGNADPHALMVASAAFEAINVIGMPEGRIVLAQATTYLASAPKSNASYLAIDEAMNDLQSGTPADVPLHLRNAPVKLMKEFGYAAGYKYPHDFGGFTEQDYFPPASTKKVYYRPTENGVEQRIRERLLKLWPKRNR
jgi:putative ATPase